MLPYHLQGKIQAIGGKACPFGSGVQNPLFISQFSKHFGHSGWIDFQILGNGQIGNFPQTLQTELIDGFQVIFLGDGCRHSQAKMKKILKFR
jgi:hypothetical protein